MIKRKIFIYNEKLTMYDKVIKGELGQNYICYKGCF